MAIWTFYDSFAENQLNGNGIDLDTATLKVAIIDATLAPSAASHTVWDDYKSGTNREVSGTGYTAGGETVAIDPISAASNSAVVSSTAGSVTWSQNASGFTDGKYFVLYHDTGNPATSSLIAFTTYSGTLDLTTGDIQITFGSTGEIFELVY